MAIPFRNVIPLPPEPQRTKGTKKKKHKKQITSKRTAGSSQRVKIGRRLSVPFTLRWNALRFGTSLPRETTKCAADHGAVHLSNNKNNNIRKKEMEPKELGVKQTRDSCIVPLRVQLVGQIREGLLDKLVALETSSSEETLQSTRPPTPPERT